ncbi:hypothetical protein BVRB_4g088860 [Beta vulgaris subsp. vulgaris]|nr:hypothetical protein BVRB_4g088860 [Beta vulgaris subsp. vulgaris]
MHGYIVNAIEFMIANLHTGSTIVKFGGNGQKESKIVLEDVEFITRISGAYGYDRNRKQEGIAALMIHTNLCPVGYGPYGFGTEVDDLPQHSKQQKLPASTTVSLLFTVFQFFNHIQETGAIMAEELKDAADRGDVEFLRNCVASNKPIEYYLTLFPMIQPGDRLFGNIFHFENREDFIRGAIRTLPLHVSQQLLLQQRDEDMFNPLHKAAAVGNLEKIKIFLALFGVHLSSSLSLSLSSLSSSSSSHIKKTLVTEDR